jgi:hypothetical protein
VTNALATLGISEKRTTGFLGGRCFCASITDWAPLAAAVEEVVVALQLLLTSAAAVAAFATQLPSGITVSDARTASSLSVTPS